MILQHDLLGHFPGRTLVGVEEHIRLPVKRFPRREQFFDFRLRIRSVQQRAMRLAAHAFPNLLRRRPEADDEGNLLEAHEVFQLRGKAAAGRDERVRARGQFLHDLPFQRAKGRFAIPGKNIRNRPARARLNEFVRVEKRKMQPLRDEPAHGGFPRAHESNEREVAWWQPALHRAILPKLPADARLNFRRSTVFRRFDKLKTVKLPPVLLASASPRRAALLQLLVPTFQVIPSDAVEVAHTHLTALEVCQLNAHRKARVVAKKFPDALVLGADTLVFLDGEIFGKPRSLKEAEQMLLRLQGRVHQVVTGVSLIHLRGRRERIFAASTDVLFHPLSRAQVRQYLARIQPLDKAGAYAIQEAGELIISEISGSYSNVVGLPVELLRAELTVWTETRPRK